MSKKITKKSNKKSSKKSNKKSTKKVEKKLLKSNLQSLITIDKEIQKLVGIKDGLPKKHQDLLNKANEEHKKACSDLLNKINEYEKQEKKISSEIRHDIVKMAKNNHLSINMDELDEDAIDDLDVKYFEVYSSDVDVDDGIDCITIQLLNNVFTTSKYSFDNCEGSFTQLSKFVKNVELFVNQLNNS